MGVAQGLDTGEVDLHQKDGHIANQNRDHQDDVDDETAGHV